MTPRRFGGSELGTEAMIDVTIELASACPSTGWVHMLGPRICGCSRCFPPDPGRALEQPEHARVVGGQYHGRRRAGRRRLSLVRSRLLLQRRRPLQLAHRARADQARGRRGPPERRWMLSRARTWRSSTTGTRWASKAPAAKRSSSTTRSSPTAHDLEHGRRGGPRPAARSTPTRCTAQSRWPISPRPWPRRPSASRAGSWPRSRSACAASPSTIDDGSMVNIARYVRPRRQVDAVHAVTLQNAQRFAACRPPR